MSKDISAYDIEKSTDEADAVARKRVLQHERTEILQQLEDWLEVPMLVLAFAWLVLLLIEFVRGLSPLLEAFGTVIWVIFIFDFAVKFTLAPLKIAYLKSNWLTAIALVVPALRVFRIVRVVRLFQVARAARGLRLVRVITSLNRGMKALGASMGRRGLGYVLSVSVVMLLGGAAGMFAFEHEVQGGFASYGEALWWTAMLLTSIGSQYWPQTAEGRVLCFILALYGFTVFGYVTAALATFFIGRDASNEGAEIAGAKSIEELRREISALRVELNAIRTRDDLNNNKSV